MRSTSLLAVGFICTLALASCARPAAEPPPPPAADASSDLTPVLSIRELMTHIVDPTADWIFDAAVVDVGAAGTTTTVPVNDDDWTKVERGLVTLAEASNLLKMRRHVAPAGSDGKAEGGAEGGKGSPELSPEAIEARIEQDRARWNQHADELRVIALASLPLLKKRDPEVLFKIGGDIDNACESCHLEYWYPGDRAAVDQFRNSTVTPPRH